MENGHTVEVVTEDFYVGRDLVATHDIVPWMQRTLALSLIMTPQFYVGGDLGITLDLELWHRRVLASGVKLTANHYLAGLGANSATIINNYTGQARQLEELALAVVVTPQIASAEL